MLLAVLLLGVLIVREPHVREADEVFLRWLLRNAPQKAAPAPLAIIDMGRDRTFQKSDDDARPAVNFGKPGAASLSSLEYALLLQSLLTFQPTVVAFEPVLRWRENERDEQQVFIDQALRVPKLLLAAVLTDAPDPDAPGQDLPAIKNVTGKRTDLPAFTGIERQPDEELRLISTLGFVNTPNEDDLRVPMLFQYRGEVIPSFVLQAVMLWLRATPAEVKVTLGSRIELPGRRVIPIASDGSILVNTSALRGVRRISFNELLLAAQQRDSGAKPAPHFDEIKDQLVLIRRPDDPVGPPESFAAAIATIQTNTFVRRVHWAFDCALIAAALLATWLVRNVTRTNLLLAAFAITAAYALIALMTVSQLRVWLPAVLPMGLLWFVTILKLLALPPRQPNEPTPEPA